MEDTNLITITDEDGNEMNVEIVLTFDYEANGRSYVLFTDPEDEEGNVYAYAYTEDGEMNEIDDDEWEICNEVLGAFLTEETEE